jgi:hypothetical protein
MRLSGSAGTVKRGKRHVLSYVLFGRVPHQNKVTRDTYARPIKDYARFVTANRHFTSWNADPADAPAGRLHILSSRTSIH